MDGIEKPKQIKNIDEEKYKRGKEGRSKDRRGSDGRGIEK
jgi:hypothetical protein